ncbi:15928_t:CDS:2 [Funneliformis mosseae]|uniref:15928_t:CDS:1 n=1 Tax=Funneliformis mosseae TaxID=27381 RepID=A0A9N9HRE7_FUNMO|nr:15928_t:CDS:2 [Funneliformis mosseae]
MNKPEPEPHVIQLPSKNFKSKRVQLADQATEERKSDIRQSKKSFNRKWRQRKNDNWKKSKVTNDELEKKYMNGSAQKRISLPSNSYPNRWYSKQIEEAGIIATAAKRPGEDRGQFQRSFDTFMFGSRSVLQDPPIIKSGDYRLKYKSVQELIDSAAVSDKIYKYPVNDMTGTYQRSMTSAKLGASTTSSRFPLERRRISSMIPVLPNEKSQNHFIKPSSSIPESYEHSLINDDVFGKKRSVDSDNNYLPPSSSLSEDEEQFHIPKRARNESANQTESRNRVAGPISRLPPLPPSQVKALVSNSVDISNEPQILDNIMAQYRSKREKLLKDESKITEEQWSNKIALLDLPKAFITSTLQALQEKKCSRKVGVIIGQISKVHSTKQVLTLRDYTGEIKALVQDKVIRAYDSMLSRETILVLTNITFQYTEGLPPFITITLNNIYTLYVDEHNKIPGYGTNIHRN